MKNTNQIPSAAGHRTARFLQGALTAKERQLPPEIKLTSRVAVPLPDTPVSAGKLVRMVNESTANAVDATPGGGQVIAIAMRCDLALGGDFDVFGKRVPPGAWLRLTVHDSGIGIPASDRERIFEAGFTTKARGKGHGLGLARVKRMVEEAGGQIVVSGAFGIGSRFDLYLPAEA